MRCCTLYQDVGIFLSYSRKDMMEILAVENALFRLGVPFNKVFRDITIKKGDNWKDELARALKESNLHIFLWTKFTPDSETIESERATSKRLREGYNFEKGNKGDDLPLHPYHSIDIVITEENDNSSMNLLHEHNEMQQIRFKNRDELVRRIHGEINQIESILHEIQREMELHKQETESPQRDIQQELDSRKEIQENETNEQKTESPQRDIQQELDSRKEIKEDKKSKRHKLSTWNFFKNFVIAEIEEFLLINRVTNFWLYIGPMYKVRLANILDVDSTIIDESGELFESIFRCVFEKNSLEMIVRILQWGFEVSIRLKSSDVSLQSFQHMSDYRNELNKFFKVESLNYQMEESGEIVDVMNKQEKERLSRV